MAENYEDRPDITSSAFDVMYERWKKVDVLLGKTEAMRQGFTDFLLQRVRETDLEFEYRIRESVLYDFLTPILDDWTGKPFSEPVTLSDDTPQKIKDIAKDVDLMGTDISTFFRQGFWTSLSRSFSPILIKNTRELPPEESSAILDQGERPYIVQVDPRSIFFTFHDPRGTLEEFRRWTMYERRKGNFGSELVRNIEQVLPGTLNIYEPEENGTGMGGGSRFQLTPSSSTPFVGDTIPLYVFYAHQEGYFVGQPPIMDIVDLSVRHWQLMTYLDAAIDAAAFPILVGTGVDTNQADQELGPYSFLKFSDPQAKLFYVEYTGKSIQIILDQLDRIERKIRDYSSAFADTGPQTTATEIHYRSAVEGGTLKEVTYRYQSFCTMIMHKMCESIGIPPTGSVQINTDFASPAVADKALDAMFGAVDREIIPKRWAREWLNAALSIDWSEEDLVQMDADLLLQQREAMERQQAIRADVENAVQEMDEEESERDQNRK